MLNVSKPSPTGCIYVFNPIFTTGSDYFPEQRSPIPVSNASTLCSNELKM
jgi:hypothetical protein